MNNDLISRKALLNDLEYYISHSIQGSDSEYAYIRAKEKVEAAPAVVAAPEWISVDERLPETDDWVAVWYCDKDGDCFPTVGQYRYNAFGDKKHWFTDVDLNDSAYPPAKITHWMPLPQGLKEVKR